MQPHTIPFAFESSGQNYPTHTVSSPADQVCTDGLKSRVGVSKGYAADLSDADRMAGCFFDDMAAITSARLANFNSPASKPAAPGLYEVLAPVRCIRTETRFYAIWSGQQWGRAMSSKERALACDTPAMVQAKAWRPVEGAARA